MMLLLEAFSMWTADEAKCRTATEVRTASSALSLLLLLIFSTRGSLWLLLKQHRSFFFVFLAKWCYPVDTACDLSTR